MPVPGTSVSSVTLLLHNTRVMGIPLSQHPGAPWVLFGFNPESARFINISDTYVDDTDGCGSYIYVAGIPENSEHLCHNTPGTWMPFLYLPAKARATMPNTSVSSVRDFYAPRTRNFCEFCMTCIPVPGTSIYSIRRRHNTLGVRIAHTC